jgi:hypothetical protein
MTVKPTSIPLIDAARRIVHQFPNVTIRFDGHCGLGAPNNIADRFSLARSLSVVHELCTNNHNTHDEEHWILNRIEQCNGWGKRIVQHIVDIEEEDDNDDNTPHPFQFLASRGRGWTEMYLQLDDICLPPVPSYYYNNTHGRHLTTRTFDQRSRMNYMRQVMRDAFDGSSSSSSSDEEDNESLVEDDGASSSHDDEEEIEEETVGSNNMNLSDTENDSSEEENDA